MKGSKEQTLEKKDFYYSVDSLDYGPLLDHIKGHIRE
jgi:hypothetical protein